MPNVNEAMRTLVKINEFIEEFEDSPDFSHIIADVISARAFMIKGDPDYKEAAALLMAGERPTDAGDAPLFRHAGVDQAHAELDQWEKRLGDLRKQVDIASDPGNAHANDYLHGMANGAIMALATMTGTEPEYIKRKRSDNSADSVLQGKSNADTPATH